MAVKHRVPQVHEAVDTRVDVGSAIYLTPVSREELQTDGAPVDTPPATGDAPFYLLADSGKTGSGYGRLMVAYNVCEDGCLWHWVCQISDDVIEC